MKKLTTSLALLLLAFVVLSSQAQTIRRCNNIGVTGLNIYSTIQAAHDAAANGDIIYVEPSGISYGNLTCIKPLTIIGNGYFLSQQVPSVQVDPRQSELAQVIFAAGSAGSRITGCTINSTFAVAANNVTVERNFIATTFYLGSNPFTGIATTISSGLIRQNYFLGGSINFNLGGATTISNVLIANNIILNGIAGGNSPDLNSVLIMNNVLGRLAGNGGGDIDVDNCVIKNNIVTDPTATFTLRANATSNNLGAGTQFGTSNGNQQNVSMTGMFVGGTASTDGAFRLAAGSPAIGAGESGVDAGAYGGGTPYRIAGIPSVPTIYQYSQSVTGNTLNATISTRSNN
jgi:hypothetical protein